MTELKILQGRVGQSAIFIACSRRMESRRPDALFHDPFAEAILEILADDPTMANIAAAIGQSMDSDEKFNTEYFAVRTRFLDDGIQKALRNGARQVVSLGAGFDGRTLRLDCPDGTDWYEVDLPEVVEPKAALVTLSGLAPTCTRHDVVADLSGDWVPALLAAGFNPDRPTVWLLEGLVFYLTEDAVERLVNTMTALSASGSALLLEHLAIGMLGEAGRKLRALNLTYGIEWISARDDLAPWLAGHGWAVEVFAHDDPRIGHGRKVAENPAMWLASGVLTGSAPAGAAAKP
ncbi:SAM-dependent methyltransferase [Micromonospora sp. KC207]|uniref:class I SAM-dependent methyltransferase n=1 Tax=Micromonospora sp. KC207 TaxID=2530377 RepID=UPI00104B0C48|nr:SAM-dependent methyltransferase [Micromonospora sp. KC207]TDC52885.1 SAM-dependent methyltransferase [Micromonospora sp. KC207]